MHDLAKTTTVTPKAGKGWRWLRRAIYGLIVVLAIAGLVFLKIATLVIAIIVLTSGAIVFGLIAFNRFRSKRTTAGAVFAVLAVFCLLADLKGFQFLTMTVAGKKMGPPPTTVTSVQVKEEDRAPFDGQLGIRQVNVGQMIKEGQQVVALTALDPLYVDFALPQQDLAKLSNDLEVRVLSDAIPGREFKGKLTAINSMVDSVTRNVTLQATLENPDHALHPGMFGKIEVVLPEKHKTLVVPGSAISYAPFGDSVFVIEKKKDPKTGKESQAIRQQFVRVGEARGDFVSITDGLKPNETVVSTGVFKLRNGMPVTIDNTLAPKPQVNPTPVDS